ncbi:MAG: VOC family protein [Pseudomonadota bacterium]|nr:VOC family protein [Pseudomonadota bacterium]
MTHPPSSFIWYELMTTDVDAASRFYGGVVGWTVQRASTPGMDYRMWMMGDTAVGGLLAISADASASGMRPTWMGYANVADVDVTLVDIQAAGGAVHMPATDIPDVGRIAMITDPQGAALYVMAPKGTGTSRAFSPAEQGHCGWHELHTQGWEAAFEFYSKHLGWRKSDALDMGPMGMYLLFNAGGEAIGGMMNNPNLGRPQWLFYFNVDDIQSAKNRVETAGGAVLQGPHQVPGGGWIIQGRDPQGAMFALFNPPGG